MQFDYQKMKRHSYKIQLKLCRMNFFCQKEFFFAIKLIDF